RKAIEPLEVGIPAPVLPGNENHSSIGKGSRSAYGFTCSEGTGPPGGGAGDGDGDPGGPRVLLSLVRSCRREFPGRLPLPGVVAGDHSRGGCGLAGGTGTGRSGGGGPGGGAG